MSTKHHRQELPRESILVRQTQSGKPWGDGTQTDALGDLTLVANNEREFRRVRGLSGELGRLVGKS